MAVTVSSSQTIKGPPQKDGRIPTLETFTLSNATSWQRHYLLDPATDFAAHLAASGVALLADLATQEINANFNEIVNNGSAAVVSLVYSVVADNAAMIRSEYLSATRIGAVMIADFLNTLTNAQLQAAFGLTAAQVTTLRTNKLTPAATLATSIRAATGQ